MSRHPTPNPLDWTREELQFLARHYGVGTGEFRNAASKADLTELLQRTGVLPLPEEVA